MNFIRFHYISKDILVDLKVIIKNVLCNFLVPISFKICKIRKFKNFFIISRT